MGFFKNVDDTSEVLSVLLATAEAQPVEYSIEIPYLGYSFNGTVSIDDEVILNLPTHTRSSNSDRDRGVYVTVYSDNVTVIGQNFLRYSTDSYFALPIIELDDVHVYYGMSVPRTVVHSFLYNSTIMIVGAMNNTTINLTVMHSVDISVGNVVTNLLPGRQYTFVINWLQTVFIKSGEDLSGTKVITDKPVSMLSGHECANIPRDVVYCDHLIEQIPPTALWGNIYYVAPLVNKSSYTIKVLAAHNYTYVNLYCNNTMESFAINEGEFINRTVQIKEYCAIYSNQNVLVVQLSHGSAEDAYGDPMMTLVPAVNQYLNKFDFSTVRDPLQSVFTHYVNIIVMEQYYQPNMIYLIAGGENRSLVTQQWIPIQVNNNIEAYATQVSIPEGIAQVFHTNATAQMMTIVYGFAIDEGYGHIGGISIPTAAGY